MLDFFYVAFFASLVHSFRNKLTWFRNSVPWPRVRLMRIIERNTKKAVGATNEKFSNSCNYTRRNERRKKNPRGCDYFDCARLAPGPFFFACVPTQKHATAVYEVARSVLGKNAALGNSVLGNQRMRY
jgi:hypothetical protein